MVDGNAVYQDGECKVRGTTLGKGNDKDIGCRRVQDATEPSKWAKAEDQGVIWELLVFGDARGLIYARLPRDHRGCTTAEGGQREK